MKLNQKIAALSLALGAASAAQATDIYITGSTAFRNQVEAALPAMNLTIQHGRSGTGNNVATFSGTVADLTGGHITLGGLAGDSVNVYCTFSGSVEGIQALVSPGSATYDNVGPVGNGQFTHTGVDLALSDVLISSTQFAANSSSVTALATAANASIGGIAVQPFCIAGNAAAGAKISNVTSQNILDTLDFGGLDLPLFTGNPADHGTTVLFDGRYLLSGTRVSTEFDNGDPNGVSDALIQYALVSQQNQTPPGLVSTDTATPAGTYWQNLTAQNDAGGNPIDNAGTNGYFTGGNVGAALDYSSVNNSQDPTQTYVAPVIAYISFSDAQGKLASSTTHLLQHGNVVMNWNGQTPGAPGAWNITGVENGSYTYWNYERLYTHNPANSFVQNTFTPAFLSALEYEISTTSPRTAVLLSEMNVTKNGDVVDVAHN